MKKIDLKTEDVKAQKASSHIVSRHTHRYDGSNGKKIRPVIMAMTYNYILMGGKYV